MSILQFLFAHHPPERRDRCVAVPWPNGGALFLCARCLGIWPVTFALLVADLGGWLPLVRLGTAGAILLPIPAVVSFWAETTGRIAGSNALRIATAIPLGVALAELFARYLRRPSDPLFWSVTGLYGAFCLFVLLRARARRPPT